MSGLGSIEWSLVGAIATHAWLAALLANALEAPGVPVPSRMILVVAGMLAPGSLAVALTVLAAAGGAVLTDQVLYAGGRRGGGLALARGGRVAFGSDERAARVIALVRRIGAPALVLCRFSTTLRFSTAILSGCGRLDYCRFLAWDVAGALLYASVWVVGGHLFADHVGRGLAWVGRQPLLLLAGPATALAIVAWRLVPRPGRTPS
jgi:membrane protein DedA with SNARE-associated domain